MIINHRFSLKKFIIFFQTKFIINYVLTSHFGHQVNDQHLLTRSTHREPN